MVFCVHASGDDLAQRWRRAVQDAGATADPTAVADAGRLLVERWSEPHRRYHDLDHLVAVLTGLDTLSAPEPVAAVLRLAAWFHDAVYDGTPGADEEASAALAERVLTELGVPSPAVAEAARLVRLTADHRVGEGDMVGALLVDADLAILAAPRPAYRRYVEAVRREYTHVPDAMFAAGRNRVLAESRGPADPVPHATGRRLWEDAARANLAAELEQLSEREHGPR